MKIHFNQTVQTDTSQESLRYQVRRQQAGKSGGYAVYFDGKERIHPGCAMSGRLQPGQSAFASRGITMAQLQTQAEGVDIQLLQDQMTVMSHTMSDADYAQMCEEGYDPRQMDPRDAVTILDKIKAELVKAGCHIAGYTDTLDLETLTAAVGDPGLARTLQESFAAADIPLSSENVEKTLQALELADGLELPDEGDCYYMIRSGLEATVKGYYLAEASGSAMGQEQQAEYFDAGIRGYVTRNIAQFSDGKASAGGTLENGETVSREEMDRLLASLGCSGTDQEREAAFWLIRNGIEVDSDSLRRTMELRSVSFPLEEDRVVRAAAAAIADGKDPMEGNLADPRSIRQKARELAVYYQSEDAGMRISDHRLLEEIRLRMTVETNVRLLESGFSIDTQPIEETIEALKQAQQELARGFFPEKEITDGEALDRYRNLEASWKVAGELPGLPLGTVGLWQERLQEAKTGEGTLAEFHRMGKTLQAEYARAGQRYEALWTSPRADMGDSIRKAFANVDAILQDMGYELTQENRRAVRILGYNQMEITPERLEEIKAAYTAVEEVARRMTPAAVLQMIRDGVNPLEQSLPQLQAYFARKGREPEQETERYSRFLYKLEKKGDITPEEKSAFIGCYRLLRQIEKSDSAAVGAVVNMGTELNFSTLLSAVRSRRAGHMDTRVDDAVGSLSRLENAGVRIDEQIRLGYLREWNQVLSEAVEADAGKAVEESRQLRQEYERAAGASQEVCRQLERAGEAPTVTNVLAAQGMESEIREIINRWNAGGRRRGKPAMLWEQLQRPGAFRELYQEAVEEREEELHQEILEKTDSLVDVRSMQLLAKQLHLMGSLSGSEEYYFPMELGSETAAIHLQLCHGEQEKGLVRIELTSSCMGSLRGEFQVKDGVVNGYFAGNQEEAVMNLRRSADIFDSYLAGELQLGRVEYVYSASGKTAMSWDRDGMEEAAQQSSLYATAKAFLQTVRDVEKQMEGNPMEATGWEDSHEN